MIETKKDTENKRKRTIKLFIDVILLDRAPYNVSLRMYKIVRQSVNTRTFLDDLIFKCQLHK